MMLSALLSFLGGSAFRMIWGEVSSYFTKKQDHAYDLALAEVQAKAATAQHAMNMEAQRLQAELGIKTINVKAEADVSLEETMAFREAVVASMKPSGVVWVDAWNAAVRPAYASVALGMWLFIMYGADFKPSEWDLALMAMIAGFFFADRSLSKRDK